MKELIIDNDSIRNRKIDEEVTRVKALIVNDENEILLVHCYNEYQFPGGHLEGNETNEAGLLREIKEETGIETKIEDYSYLMTIKDYTKNYREKGVNRCNKIVYYVLNENYDIDLTNANFSDYEKKGDFKLEWISLDSIEEILIKNGNSHSFAKLIVDEMLYVLKEYKSINNSFIFKKSVKADIDEIIDLKLKVYEDMENKDWYEVNGTTKEFLNNLLDNNGLLLKVNFAKTGELAGFLMVKNKIRSDGGLSKIINDIELDKCIEMCNSSVLPKFRGNKLQQRLIIMAENMMIKENANIKYSVATVHPDNVFSINSFVNLGYKKIGNGNLYGDKIRCVMKKNLIR